MNQFVGKKLFLSLQVATVSLVVVTVFFISILSCTVRNKSENFNAQLIL